MPRKIRWLLVREEVIIGDRSPSSSLAPPPTPPCSPSSGSDDRSEAKWLIDEARWEKGTAVDRERTSNGTQKLDPLLSLSSKSPLFNQEECGESPPHLQQPRQTATDVTWWSRRRRERRTNTVWLQIVSHADSGQQEQERWRRPGPNLPSGIWNNFWTFAVEKVRSYGGR